jgi:hypothetical protein
MKMAFKAKAVRRVTRPVLKLEEGKPVFVKALKAFYEGREIKPTSSTEAQMKPATLLDVVNLETGEEAQIVAGAVLASNLAEAYPSDSYVGKCFQITKEPKAKGKRYFTFDIIEIEDPTAAPGASKK